MGTRGKQGVHWENGLTVATLSFPLNIMTDNPGLFQLATFYGAIQCELSGLDLYAGQMSYL